MKQRRVVTGIQDGHEVIVADTAAEAISVGAVEVTLLNRIDTTPVVPNDGSYLPRLETPADFVFPGPGGIMVSTFRVGAHTSLPGPPEDHGNAGRPGYHATDSVDCDLVLEGEIEYEIEDGSVVTLRQGDWIIKNGTGHAWHNRSSAPAMIMSVNYGAHRADATARK